ncbi:MAG: flagellar basal body L-ring protein FlgH [Alphaproteobacteria bacterium]
MSRRLAPAVAALAALALAGCNAADRLSNVGRAPDLSPIANPQEEEGYRPVSMPMPPPEVESPTQSNSLWRTGARGFFKDQRARRVGDILTVDVTIQDEATLNNGTTRSRDNSEDLGVGGLFGAEQVADTALADRFEPERAVDLSSSMSGSGEGSVSRDEEIELNVAAVIVQVLPNGNLVIQGRQEVRVNFEKRELVIAGIVRPEDIGAANTIPHDQIAELRVAYGGEGQISDVQQPRYGSQVLDILLPF